jgi:hypothetical protein
MVARAVAGRLQNITSFCKTSFFAYNKVTKGSKNDVFNWFLTSVNCNIFK